MINAFLFTLIINAISMAYIIFRFNRLDLDIHIVSHAANEARKAIKELETKLQLITLMVEYEFVWVEDKAGHWTIKSQGDK